MTIITTAKEYLSRIRSQNKLLKQKELECRKVRLEILSIKSTVLTEKVTGTKNTDLSDKYVRWEKYSDSVTKEWDKLISMRTEAKDLIENLTDEHHKAVLYARYINCQNWDRIAVEMNYSWRGIFKLHGRALIEFSDINKGFIEVH